MAGISIKQLQRVILTISSEQTAAASARSVVREAARLVGGARAVLAFFDADGQIESVTRYAVGAETDDTPILRDDEQFLQTTFADARTVLHEPDAVLPLPAIAVPCQPGTRTVGALAVVFGSPNRRPDPTEIEALSHLGVIAAISIENARLSDIVQQSAVAEDDLSAAWHGYVEALPTDMIFVTDVDGRIIDANRAAWRALGYTKHELIHRGIADIVPSPAGAEDQGLLQGLIMQILAGNITQFESALMSKSGRVFPVVVHCRPLENDGNPVIISVATDQSERKRAETQLVQTQRLRALGEMAAGVVHDINNMLTAALGPIEIILAQSRDPVTRTYLPGVQRALLDGAQTVRRIQDFARQGQAGRPQFAPTDLGELAQDVVDLIRPRWQTQARQSGINLDVAVHAAGRNVVLGNPVELREMLVNVVNNAIDAMPVGGRIDIGVETSGSTVTLKVADTGIGMPPDVVQRIFDPFFTTKGIHGSGLGLSVVYGIVARHHGDIGVDSVPGRGTTFTMSFPGAEPEAESTLANQEVTTVDGLAMPADRPLNVMVIDDQPQVASVLKLMLELEGHRAALFTSGAPALAAINDERWDLICTDLDMPGLSGWDVALAVKQAYPTLSVAIVTGWSEQYSASELARRGVDSVLSKPYQISDVHALAEEVRSRRG